MAHIDDEEYIIDPELVRRWQEIPRDRFVNFRTPRGQIDLLYIAIEKALRTHITVLNMVNVLAAKAGLPPMGVEDHVISETVSGMNALRHYQTIIMTQATGSILDENHRIKDRTDSNG